jgi:molecular chaperone GrpE
MSDIKVVDRRWWAREGDTAAAEEQTSLKPSYVEELERKLAEKDREIQELLGKYRGANNQFEESRTRLRKEMSKDLERGRRAVLVELLEVVDNLDRAIEAGAEAFEAGDPSQNFQALLQGIIMVHQQFLAKLEGFGVRRIDLQDQTFDPARHEAVTSVPVELPEDDGKILGIVAHGYVIESEILRPAMVAVGKYQQITAR